MLNYSNIAPECGISSQTVKEYFSKLEETLIGCLIPGFTNRVKRRVIPSPRFYYFDAGIANFLLKRSSLQPGSPESGHTFRRLIIQEIIAYNGCSGQSGQISHWRPTADYEVDVIPGDAEVAVGIESSEEVHLRHARGLKVALHPRQVTRTGFNLQGLMKKVSDFQSVKLCMI